MKKVLGIVLAALCAGSALAQITINSGNAPAIGSTMASYGTTGNVDWNPGSGSNQTWNITSFDYTQDGGGTYVLPSSTPYAATFPSATHCVTAGDNTWSYYRVANDGLYFVGFVALADTLEIIQDPEPDALVLRFPCTMGTNWTTVIRITYEILPGFVMTTVDSSTNTVDGWGNLTAPGWTEAALRASSHGYLSSYMNGQPLGEATESWSYMWVTQNGNRGASYSNPDATGPGFTTGEVGYTTTGTVDVDPIRGPVAENFKLSQNYPNPFNPNTTLPIELAKSAKVELTIYNEVGQVVSTMSYDLSAGQHNLPIDGSAWSTGSYFANVKAGDEAQTTRMLLVK
ncbi:MAG: T9SS type A sorting domain-containing protein [bacterium]|nr:T9SS type A sorting domain-containing protein [bacterium]